MSLRQQADNCVCALLLAFGSAKPPQLQLADGPLDACVRQPSAYSSEYQPHART